MRDTILVGHYPFGVSNRTISRRMQFANRMARRSIAIVIAAQHANDEERLTVNEEGCKVHPNRTPRPPAPDRPLGPERVARLKRCLTRIIG